MVRPEVLNYLNLLGEGGGIKMTLYYLFIYFPQKSGF